MKRIDSLNTRHGQFLMRGTQVAYVTKLEHNVQYTSVGELEVYVRPGELKVARIAQIEEKSAGFAEADGLYELTLDDGARVCAEEVAVTDGNFRYGTRG